MIAVGRTAGMSLTGRPGHVRGGLIAQALGVRSDAEHQGALVGALWAAGTVPCQAHALAAFDAAWHSGAFRCAIPALSQHPWTAPAFCRDVRQVVLRQGTAWSLTLALDRAITILRLHPIKACKQIHPFGCANADPPKTSVCLLVSHRMLHRDRSYVFQPGCPLAPL